MLDLVIDAGPETLQTRLFQSLRSLISDGALPAGTRLPSSRRFADDLGVSRTTVLAVFEQLIADGWLHSRRGSGTYIAETLPNGAVLAANLRPLEDRQGQTPFSVGVPGLDLFPLHSWSRLQARRWRQMPRSALEEGDSGGWSELRRSIAAHLRISRNISCEPAQIIVTTGTRASIFLAARVLAGTGDTAWVEDPGYFGAKDALRSQGLRLAPIPVDAEGINVAEGERIAPFAKLAVVTSHCQFPTGVAMSPERREALIGWADQQDAWILDNGYDSEFALGAERASSMAASSMRRTIYLNSFNKILFPALRIGYLVAPPHLVDAFTAARNVMDAHSNVPNQMVLHDFLEGGQFDKHVRTCRAAYIERRDELVATLEGRLAPWLSLHPHTGGLHLTATVDGRVSPQVLVERASAAGIDLTPMSRFFEHGRPCQQVLLGFAGFSESNLRAAAERLARVCAKLPG